jgi:hypothetical protein
VFAYQTLDRITTVRFQLNLKIYVSASKSIDAAIAGAYRKTLCLKKTVDRCDQETDKAVLDHGKEKTRLASAP